MATYSTGVTATWGGAAFEEIVELSYTYGGGLPKGRAVIWSDELGSVTLTCLGSANISSAQYGQRKQLVLAGGGQSLSVMAVCESLTITPQLNDVTRFAVTFKILDA